MPLCLEIHSSTFTDNIKTPTIVLYLRLVYEAFRFSMGALRNNMLRTFLSLTGVTVGVFAIISVLTVVDSLEDSIKGSFSFLGDNVINIDKWPYGLGGEYPWWEYLNRPYPSYEEYEFLRERMEHAAAITIYSRRGNTVAKYASNSYDESIIMGVSSGYDGVKEVLVEEGRYFTEQELNSGRNVALIGHTVAQALFPRESPIGKFVKVRGIKFRVVGTMPEEGESFLGFPSNDENIIIPYLAYKSLFYTGGRYSISSTISVKGFPEDEGLEKLEWESRGLMRGIRGLKPKAEDSFALNRPEAINQAIGATFSVLEVAGWFIGLFSMLIGAIGIANIMFVSVKERTPLIGIQKSLGAKTHFILFQFLFEAVFLCLLGGLIGLILVYIVSFIDLGSLDLVLTTSNVTLGCSLAVFAGVSSGIIPAWMASRMDPVQAIRS